MKKAFTVLFVFQVFSSFGQKQNDGIESILLDCLTESYLEHHVELERELAKLETYLQEQGTLRATTGRAYYEFFEQIAQHNDIPGGLDDQRFGELLKLGPDQYYSSDCLKKLSDMDSTTAENSKYIMMTLKVRETVQAEEITLSKVVRAIISVLEPKDFENPYYRSIALLAIIHLSNTYGTLVATLDPKEKIDYSDFTKTTVHISNKGEVLLNGGKVGKEEFQKELRRCILDNESKHFIRISNDKKTLYSDYLSVLDLIAGVYVHVRNERAKKLFGKPFEDLNTKQQDEIRRMYPDRIKEESP